MSHTKWALSGFGDEISDDPVVQIAVLQALGASHIEIRSVWGTNIIELDDTQLTELKHILDGENMGVSAIASPIGKIHVDEPIGHELERLDRAIAAAQLLNSKYVRIFSFYYEGRDVAEVRETVLSYMSALADRAHGSGIVLIHENEKGIFGDTPERVVDILGTVNSPSLRAAWDPANFVQVGVENPFTYGYTMIRPYLEYLQVKDALSHSGIVVPAGQGDGQLAETIKALAKDGYVGFASLEPHLHDVNNLGGFSGPALFGQAGRAFRTLAENKGVTLV